jgi:methyltransferase (TIGR00027 family)
MSKLELTDGISATALITAYARALESQRSDALFRDELARVFAGEQGPTLVAGTLGFNVIANSVACRTAVFDELIEGLVLEHNIDFVLNLAAGLDARPWRLQLPTALQWVDVDMPHVLDYKMRRARRMPECRYATFGADLSTVQGRRAAARRLPGLQRSLVVTEGLLVYMSEDEVGDLAQHLGARPSAWWWITDLGSAPALQFMERHWGPLLPGIEFKFGPTDPRSFFSARGWHEDEFRCSEEEAQRLGRAPAHTRVQRLARALLPRPLREQVRRLAGVVVMERLAG